MKTITKVALLIFAITLAVPAMGQEVVRIKPGTAGVNVDSNLWSSGASWTTESTLNLGPSGTWWRNKTYIDGLSLTTEQQKKMDEVFQQYRVKLIDLNAGVDREEAILEPMLEAAKLDEAKAAAQIDKVADARAALEKTNARMLLAIRQVLTPEQWTKLNTNRFPGNLRLRINKGLF
jgi:Spy/CpxP family protein refolding chaperone